MVVVIIQIISGLLSNIIIGLIPLVIIKPIDIRFAKLECFKLRIRA